MEEGKRKSKPAVRTIQAYIEALKEAYIFYEIERFDIRGREYLRTLGKYYIVDPRLRNYILGLGKIDNREVDFIATNADEKKYIQVTESMNVPEIRERELAPLRRIKDNYEKIVIAMECDMPQPQDGI